MKNRMTLSKCRGKSVVGENSIKWVKGEWLEQEHLAGFTYPLYLRSWMGKIKISYNPWFSPLKLKKIFKSVRYINEDFYGETLPETLLLYSAQRTKKYLLLHLVQFDFGPFGWNSIIGRDPNTKELLIAPAYLQRYKTTSFHELFGETK